MKTKSGEARQKRAISDPNGSDGQRLAQAERRLTELDKLFISICNDNAAGRISDERFSAMSRPMRADGYSSKRRSRPCSGK